MRIAAAVILMAGCLAGCGGKATQSAADSQNLGQSCRAVLLSPLETLNMFTQAQAAGAIGGSRQTAEDFDKLLMPALKKACSSARCWWVVGLQLKSDPPGGPATAVDVTCRDPDKRVNVLSYRIEAVHAEN